MTTRNKYTDSVYIYLLPPCLLLLCSLVILLDYEFHILSAPVPTAHADEETVIDPFNRQIFDNAQKAIASGEDRKAVGLLLKYLESYPNDLETLRTAGKLAVKQGMDAEAESIYARIVRARPEDREAFLQFALAKQNLGEKYEAEALLTRALADGSLNEEQRARAQNAITAMYQDWDTLKAMERAKDYAAQERFLTYHINQAPDTAASAYGMRGFARHWQRRYREAVEDFTRALDIGGMPENLTAGVVNSKARAEEAIGQERLRETQQAAQELEEKDDTEALEKYYTMLLDDDLTRTNAAIERAYLRMRRGAYEEAEADLNLALTSSPDDEKTRAAVKRGQRLVAELRSGKAAAPAAEDEAEPSWREIRLKIAVYEKTKQWKKLERYLSTLTEKESTRSYALIKRAYLRMYGGNFTGAEQDLNAAARLNPDGEPGPGIVAARERLAELRADPARRRVAARPRGPNSYDILERVGMLLDQGALTEASRTLNTLRPGRLQRPAQGIYLYYQAELARRDGDTEKALEGYQAAAARVKGNFWQASVYMKLAECHAAKGETEKAEEYTERALSLSPGQVWRLNQAAYVYLRVSKADKAAEYFLRALDMDPDPAKRPEAYRGLAEAYRRLNDEQQYQQYATKYIDSLRQLQRPATPFEEATAAFFQAELYKAHKFYDRALASYEQAAALTSEKYRLSDIYISMAECHAYMRNYEQSEVYAEKSVDLLSNANWRIMQASRVFQRIGKIDRAIEYARRALELEPGSTATNYQELALLYLRSRDKETFLLYNARYIDLLTEEVESLGPAAPKELRQALYDARELQSAASRVWGFNSYHFGNRSTEGRDYMYGMVNELYRNFTTPNGWFGKMYVEVNATPTAYYTGNWYNPATGYGGRWEDRQNFKNSLHTNIGVRIHPLSFLPDLGVGPEMHFPLGHSHTQPDFRLRAEYYRSQGKRPRLFGDSWLYNMIFASAIYSTRHNDITAFGELRLGRTFANDTDRNFLVIPYAGTNWRYAGEDAAKGKQWGLQAGPGILFKYWFNEDKYHAPRSSVEFGLYYRVGVSHGRDDTVGFNASFVY